MLRTDIINALIQKFRYTSYLEIGIFNPMKNFDQIQAPYKWGIDPKPKAPVEYQMTSDEFFAQNTQIFDIIFVDGKHHADQVYKDVINSLECLAENGTVVMHDCNPPSEEAQLIPRDVPKYPSQSDIWNGDVWKAWVQLRSEVNDLEMFVVDEDYGCGVIRRNITEKRRVFIKADLTYSNLIANRILWLNLQTEGWFQSWLNIQ